MRRKWMIFKAWFLILSVVASIGFLFGYFINWQWGLGIALGLILIVVFLVSLFAAAVELFASIMHFGAPAGYIVQPRDKKRN